MAERQIKDTRKGKDKLYFDAYYDYRDDAMGSECRPSHPSIIPRSDGRIKPGRTSPREDMMGFLKDTPMHPWRTKWGKE